MDITQTLGIDNLLARRAELSAAASHKEEVGIVSSVNDAMMEYAATQTAENRKKLERAYDKLCALVFKKAIVLGKACKSYPLDEVLADGRKVRDFCDETLSVIDRVINLRVDIGYVQNDIESSKYRMDEVRRQHILPLQEGITRDTATLEDLNHKLIAAEKELGAMKVRYNVK